MVLRRGIPTTYPHMKILTFAEAINILKMFPAVQQGSNDETVYIEDLIQTARSKFLDFYRRMTQKSFNRNDETPKNFSNGNKEMDETPKTCHDDEMDDGKGDLLIVIDDEDLERMSQPMPKIKSKPNDIFKKHFPSVPKEIYWFDGKATYTFSCERYP
ncbi:hypothetical protein AVEN_169761-1 [Araneus ventricosus]|uniref:Uncharacterized protein n=1 Tax=Araneus ventricosus TaxID=182803 RepID=A0A4Y2HLP1_ARAVE|nr:hypothetical protein AVEN_169761-1 [Araneus ventricosus]